MDPNSSTSSKRQSFRPSKRDRLLTPTEVRDRGLAARLGRVTASEQIDWTSYDAALDAIRDVMAAEFEAGMRPGREARRLDREARAAAEAAFRAARRCEVCDTPIPTTARRDTVTCSVRCRVAKSRMEARR